MRSTGRYPATRPHLVKPHDLDALANRVSDFVHQHHSAQAPGGAPPADPAWEPLFPEQLRLAVARIPGKIKRRGDPKVRNPELANDPHVHAVYPWLLRLFVSILAVAAYGLVVFSSQNELPFFANCGDSTCEVTGILEDARTSPLHVGDRIPIAAQPFATRAALLASNVPQNRQYTFQVERGPKRLTVVLQAVPAARAGLHRAVATAATRTVIGFALLFGLLMLWRGETVESQGLCLFALSIVVAVGVMVPPLAPPWNLVTEGILSLLGGPVALFGMFLTADALVHPDLGAPSVRRSRAAYLGVLALLYLTELVPNVLMAAGQAVPAFNAVQILGLVVAAIAWIVPLLYLLKGYRTSTPERRLRIRWFIVSIALLLPVLVCNTLINSGNPAFRPWHDFLFATQILLNLALFAILSYAALSQRLVAVRFVLNRALVFGILTASLIGTLSLLESLIERSVISHEAGLALDIVVPLLLGVSLHRIHRWGEESVERVVFRREYRDRHEIATFVRDAGFISQPSTLFERTVAVFAAHGGGRHATLYLTGKTGFERVAASDAVPELPERVAIDDPAMVRLRATLAPLDLFTLASTLGATGLALPLAIRGRLEGVLVCGAKREGRYAQAEIEFLGKAAADITACVIALRAELQGRFVSRVAEGTLPAQRIVEEAQGLTQL